MTAVLVIVVIAVSIGAMMWVMADRIESGQTQPNMGHHTRESTTPESWARASAAIAEAMRWGAKHYAFAAVLSIAVAAWTGSGSSGAGAGSAVFLLSACVMVVGIVRAIGMLEPNGNITR